MVASLEEWAARLLEPDISMILNEARKDKDTSARFSRAKKPTKFSITEYDYKNIAPDDSDDEPIISTSPDKHKNKSNEELLLKISMGLLKTVSSLVALSTIQLKLSSIISKTCMSSTNRKLRILQCIKREAVSLSTILMTRNLTNQPPQVTVNQVATKKPQG